MWGVTQNAATHLELYTFCQFVNMLCVAQCVAHARLYERRVVAAGQWITSSYTHDAVL